VTLVGQYSSAYQRFCGFKEMSIKYFSGMISFRLARRTSIYPSSTKEANRPASLAGITLSSVTCFRRTSLAVGSKSTVLVVLLIRIAISFQYLRRRLLSIQSPTGFQTSSNNLAKNSPMFSLFPCASRAVISPLNIGDFWGHCHPFKVLIRSRAVITLLKSPPSRPPLVSGCVRRTASRHTESKTFWSPRTWDGK